MATVEQDGPSFEAWLRFIRIFDADDAARARQAQPQPEPARAPKPKQPRRKVVAREKQ